MSDLKNSLDAYLGKNGRYTEKNTGDGYTEVCDLDNNECYKVSMRDGLIERVDNIKQSNKKIKVETNSGYKQLLID